MESFHWDKHFETGLETVDQQHRTLVDLINRFGELLTQAENVPFEEIEALFVELTAYTQYHFQEEENLMLQVGLDAGYISLHKQLHTDFLQEVITTHEAVLESHETAGRLLKLLTYWLAYHILGTDQSMSRQVAAVQSGQASPEDAYLAEKEVKEGATEPLLVALNGLFQQVSERNRELLELNRTLEEKVEERTHALSEANRLLEELAMTDVLTGLPNRRHAMARLTQAWNISMHDHSPMACMMIDADGFKQINDNFGHDAGDEVLKQLSMNLRHVVRTDDIVCRLGGDEFLVICPYTSLEGAMLVANKMREKVANLHVAVNGGEWVGSISVGVAARAATMQNPEDLIKAADEGVYMAKRNGRNRVESSNLA
ncbi:MAG: diguanylate cyclase [Gallionellaceae bacterium]|nr:diguanylate cyclase [Gallionellaceae bacterium]